MLQMSEHASYSLLQWKSLPDGWYGSILIGLAMEYEYMALYCIDSKEHSSTYQVGYVGSKIPYLYSTLVKISF